MMISIPILKAVTNLLDETSSTFTPYVALPDNRERIAAGIRRDNPTLKEDEVQATIDLGIILEALSTGRSAISQPRYNIWSKSDLLAQIDTLDEAIQIAKTESSQTPTTIQIADCVTGDLIQFAGGERVIDSDDSIAEMTVRLNVREIYHRVYEIEIPADTPPEKIESVAIEEWFESGQPESQAIESELKDTEVMSTYIKEKE